MDTPCTENGSDLHKNQIRLIGGGEAFLFVPYPLEKRNFELIKRWFALMEPALTGGCIEAQETEHD